MKISIIGQVLHILHKFLKPTIITPLVSMLRLLLGIFGELIDAFLPRKIEIGRAAHLTGTKQFIENFSAGLPLRYQDPAVKKLIWDFKYYLKPYALSLCADMMFDELLADMSDRVSSIPFSRPRLVTHCPSSTFFKGEKKFDHMKELLCAAEEQLNISHPFFTACAHAVVPRGKDQAQHLSNRAERIAFAQERFTLSEQFMHFLENEWRQNRGAGLDPNRSAPQVRTIYCIDDVTTTGSTFAAAETLLKRAFNTGGRGCRKLTVRSIALSH